MSVRLLSDKHTAVLAVVAQMHGLGNALDVMADLRSLNNAACKRRYPDTHKAQRIADKKAARQEAIAYLMECQRDGDAGHQRVYALAACFDFQISPELLKAHRAGVLFSALLALAQSAAKGIAADGVWTI